MDKLLLIDGSSLIQQSYYGSLPEEVKKASKEDEEKYYSFIKQTRFGIYTNAIERMLKTVFSIIRFQQPSHIAFAFDKSRKTFRREKYSQYKANRGNTPFPLKSQMIIMQQILLKLGFTVFINNTYEADDIIGTLAKKFETQIPCAVMTKDNDYLYLVTDKTEAWIMQQKQESYVALCDKYGNCKNTPARCYKYTPGIVKSEKGVEPWQIPDLKGIMGDTSDNIPGINGISAAAPILLNIHGTLENVYQNIEACGEDKEEIKALAKMWKNAGIVRNPMRALTAEGAKEMGLLSKELATIITNLPINVELDKLKTKISQKELNEVVKYFELDMAKLFSN